MLVVVLALKYFASDRTNFSILLHLDNTTAISQMNRVGGIHFPQLNNLSRQVGQRSEERDLAFGILHRLESSVQIPKLNFPSQLSRNFRII